MFMDGSFVRCVLVAFVGLAVLQSILIAGTGFSDDCYRELLFCFAPANQPYLEPGNKDPLAKARSIPLGIHCANWSLATSCSRRQLKTEVCQNSTSDPVTDRVTQTIKVIDLVVNYSCKKNFIRINRIYRCILDLTVFNTIVEKCKNVEVNATNACEKIPDMIGCAADGLTSRCGRDAGNVARELGPQLLEAVVESNYDRKCSTSKRDDLGSLMKRFFSRK